MDKKRFEQALDRYGADLRAWPVDLAQSARRLLAESAEVRVTLRAHRELESWIEASAPAVSDAATDRVVGRALERIRAMPERRSLMDRLLSLLPAPVPGLAFAVSATALGFVIGLYVGTPTASRSAESRAMPLTTASADDVLL